MFRSQPLFNLTNAYGQSFISPMQTPKAARDGQMGFMGTFVPMAMIDPGRGMIVADQKGFKEANKENQDIRTKKHFPA